MTLCPCCGNALNPHPLPTRSPSPLLPLTRSHSSASLPSLIGESSTRSTFTLTVSHHAPVCPRTRTYLIALLPFRDLPHHSLPSFSIMDPTADQTELDYILGVAGPPAATTVPAMPLPPAAVPPVPAVSVVPPVGPTAADVAALAAATAHAQQDDAPSASGGGAPDGAGSADGSAAPANPKKRPLEDKKARDRKRVLRNRELARVSNERRKGRIKAMENELQDTRQTVSTLEESIRCLEAENKELRNLLQGKSDGGTAPPPVPPTGATSAVDPQVVAPVSAAVAQQPSPISAQPRTAPQ